MVILLTMSFSDEAALLAEPASKPGLAASKEGKGKEVLLDSL